MLKELDRRVRSEVAQRDDAPRLAGCCPALARAAVAGGGVAILRRWAPSAVGQMFEGMATVFASPAYISNAGPFCPFLQAAA